MASTCNMLRTCALISYLIFHVQGSVNKTSDTAIHSLKVVRVLHDGINCKYLLNVSGSDFLGHYSWRLTSEEGPKGGKCEVSYPNYEIKEIETSQWFSKVEVSIPYADVKIFFCLHQTQRNSPFGAGWVHQGVQYFLEPKNDVDSLNKDKLTIADETKQDNSQVQRTETQAIQHHTDVPNVHNVKISINNDVQETKTDWADLTHDTDVNYLPSAPRPTREEKNDIEVLYQHRYVPLNDLIEQIKTKHKLKDVFDNEKRNDNQLNSIKLNSIIDMDKNSVDTKHEDSNYIGKSLNDGNNAADNVKFIVKRNNTEDIRDLELDAIQAKLESPKCEKIIAEMKHVIDELNSLPNYTTVREILARVFPNYMSIKKKLADQYVQEIIEKSLNEILQQNLANTFPEGNFFQEKLLRSPEDISVQNILDDAFPEDIMEIILVNRAPKDPFSIKNLMRSLRQAKSELDLTESASRTRKYRQAKAQVGSPESIKSWTPIQASNKDISELLLNVRKRREVDFTSVRAGSQQIVIEGVRIEDSDKEPKIVEDGIPSVLAESSVTLRVYGDGLTPNTVIAFTHDPQPFGQPCKFLVKGEYTIKEGSLQARTALFDIRPPAPITESKLYICAKNLRPGISDPKLDEEKYLHQGTETWKMVATHNKLLPLWVSISLILFCLMFSALFSGLNLGLMSLDRTELKIISNTGTEQERKYARAIMPVRDHGNYLLCSILLGNVAVNSTFTILLDELTSGLFAVIFSTLAIVLLGEITPQAICSRHGLMVGAKSIMVTKGVMALTAPLSFPVSKLLDYFLGEEIGNVYNRERLKELVKVTTDVNDLDKDEVNIISGALEMRKKTVKDVMTKLEDVFMLPISSVLDFETMSEIVKSGYSRIPVYEGGRGNIVTVLFIKDLAFVDPDDNTPLRTLCQYYQNAAHFVFEDLTLDVMFKQFKDGHKGHMAFVHRINNEGEGDPYYETIGLVTLEDVIEEMIQAEIVDETDVFLDNRSKRRRRPQNKLQDFAAFAERHENQRIHISPQLTLATFQFLSTSVDAFRPDTVSETVLRRLLRQDVIQYIKIKGKTKKDSTTFVFQQGKPVDYFLLILEGRVEVTVGRENLVFEAGPFTYFGVQALTQNIGVAESPTPSAMGSLQNINMDAMLRHTFVPDYSVRAITSLYYLTVKRSLYLAAKRATLMEKGNISKGGTTQEFDTEVDKHLCNTSSANIPISMISKKLLRKSTSTVSTREDACSTSGVKACAIVQCSNSENLIDIDNEKRTDVTRSTNVVIANCVPSSDVDAITCTECVKNNFWLNKTVLNKVEHKNTDTEPCKKKKATFHTDSSLLSFHNLSSTSQEQSEIDYKSNRELCIELNRECIPTQSHEFDFGHRNLTDSKNVANNPKCLNIVDCQIYRDIDYTLRNRNYRCVSQNVGIDTTERYDNFYSHNSATKIDTHLDCVSGTRINNQKVQHGNEYASQIDPNPQIDFKFEYKPHTEIGTSNQEHKSNNQGTDSTDPPDSLDRYFELERDTIDYEKEFREERLGVEKRRLETEQIIMMQLSKIIKMLERTQT